MSKKITERKSNEEKEEKVDMRIITVFISKVENLCNAYTACDLQIELKYLDIMIGKTDKIMITEKNLLPIEQEIVMPINIASEKSLADLFSSPLYIRLWQSPATENLEQYAAILETNPLEDPENSPITKESILSIYEAILGKKEDEEQEEIAEETIKIKSKSKAKKDDKKSGKSKVTLDLKKSKTVQKIKPAVIKEPVRNEDLIICMGNLHIDLYPLFLGETEIESVLTVHQDVIEIDEELTSIENLPKLAIKITIDRPIFDLPNVEDGRHLSNILKFTVEGIHNLPKNFGCSYDYKLSTVFPFESPILTPILIENGTYTPEFDIFQPYKLWPNLSKIKNFSNRTNEEINMNVSTIKNKIGADISNIFSETHPQVVWNVMKRIWLTDDANQFFQKTISKYRQWPIEIYLTHVPGRVEITTTTTGGKHDKASKSSRGSKRELGSQLDQFHFMTYADITNLLYPGVTKTRVACPLRTFQYQELANETGLETSYFCPNAEEDARKKLIEKTKKEKGAVSKRSPDKISVKSGVDVTKPILVVPPSVPILDENGMPTFLIIEIELMRPFSERRNLENLTEELLTIIPKRPPLPKTVLSVRLAIEMFRECIATLSNEINKTYQDYYESEECDDKDSPPNFIRYLQRKGIYQTYMSTLAKPVTLLINEKFKFVGDIKDNYQYDNYISRVYTNLIDDMNTHLNSIITCQRNTCETFATKAHKWDYLFRAAEATELDALALAERYHLQEISENTKNPDAWLHYAIFHLEQENQENAFECLKESLALQMNHRHSLLLFAIILYERNDNYLAETTFLTLLSYYPRFIEGWICLSMFYRKCRRFEGCDICLEMITKHALMPETHEDDYFYDIDGMPWTTNIALKNIYFQTGMLLIKLKALNYAELVMGIENFTINGQFKYYQAVMLYYLKDYEKALILLEDARKLHGPGYEVTSLIGHCYYRLGKLDEAKEDYNFTVAAFDRPDDMHILYIRLAMIYEKENNLEMARKLLLIVCKLSPTPYSWLLLAIVYYKETNMQYAEACLTESNTLDNRLPETWAYLVLININNGNNWEAEQCYSQLLKYNLKNEELMTIVTNNIKQIQCQLK